MRIARSMVRSVLPCILTVALLLGVISPTTSILAAPASLSVPTNVKWMDGSTATATWDAVDDANYYNVKVSAYKSGTLIGSQNTGTAICATDVQDIVRSISGVNSYQSVDISFLVQAVYKDGGVEIVKGNWSTDSDIKNYNLKSGKQFATPTGVTLNNNLKLSFNTVANAKDYMIKIVNAENTDWEEVIGYEYVYIYDDGTIYSGYGGDVSINNGVVTIDVTKGIAGCINGTDYVGKELKVYGVVQAMATGEDVTTYTNSEWSQPSGTAKYKLSLTKFATPTGVTLNNNLKLSFNTVANAKDYMIKIVNAENTDWEEVIGYEYVYIYDDGTIYSGYGGDVSINNGVVTIDVTKGIAGCINGTDYVGKELKVYGVVQAMATGEDVTTYTNSEWSQPSGTAKYKLSLTKFATPTGVTLNNNLKLSFNTVANAKDYMIKIVNAENTDWEEVIGYEYVYIYDDGTIYSGYGGDVSINNGVVTIDVTKGIAGCINGTDYVGKELKVYGVVQAMATGEDVTTYTNSEWSQPSGTAYYKYQTGKKVETITISPDNPYVPIGYTYSLGKTIEPIDAYYSSINWSSNNLSIVTVDSLGTLTGVSEGTATVTAKVDSASDTATVTVYKLETNVTEESEEDVLNYTNSVINNIVEGDATCTDITNVTKAAELIETGMDNEDEFHIDIEQGACGQDYSSAGWNTIESLYSGNPDFDPEYGGAVDVSLELYSEDDAGKETSIGNITEFDNEIQFDIDIPAGLPAVEPGYTREYSVVRVHDGQYTVLDCTLNEDYTLTVESDKFSDYVIVYNDTLTGTYPIDSAEMLPSGVAHVQDIGDVAYSVDMESGILTIGTRGMGKRLEEITINFVNTTPYEGSLEYRVHVQDIGWMDWVPAGTKCGTEGMSKRIEAIEIRLTGDLANYYSVEYCVHIQDYGDMQGWVKDGALAGTTGESKRIEELKIQIVPIGSASTMSVKYRVHVQDYGWEGAYAANGQMSGTSGQSKRLEGIEIFLEGCQYSGGVKYKTHVQDIGWEGSWSQDGEMSGTQGQSKRLEGIAIELYGEVAEYYDIYYRVHAQDIGWLGWACNGAYAGTAARSARLEGIQIVLVPKGGAAPDASFGGITSVTEVAFVEGF